jgi:asparagine synthase (glutamine-hydrolysing)
MCGLAGRFDARGLAPAPGWADEAGRRLAHRGPDGAGRYGDEWCELVHRRLALLDLSPTGAQPMTNETGSVLVVLNGEIYNHRELREELVAKGHVFRGTSDTEVIVHLYEDAGDQLPRRLRGIFALAVYDRARRRLLLARDRFGVKPLFYARHGTALLFASEMKAILAVPGFEPKLDRQACYDFLGLGYVPEPATGFANICALPHGTMLTASLEHRRVVRYHEIEFAPDPARTLDATADAFARTLSAAVERQSVADVPVAALLSGGLDSSLVVAAHHRALGRPAATFNVRFPDRAYDETPLATAVARQCGMAHTTVEIARQQLEPDALLGLLRHMDQPFADTSFIPMYAVARAVRDRGIICALSGDGGDESFGGYQRFWQLERLTALMKAPAPLRRAARLAGTRFAPATRNWGRRLAKAALLADRGRADSSELIGGLESYLTEPQKAELVDAGARETLLPGYRHFDGYRPAAVLDLEELSRRMSAALFAVSLPSDMLRKVDMMSMRAGIEVRVPLLDEDVVGIGTTLPHRLKTDGRQGKLVPRALAGRWLPPEVAGHKKRGFNIPLDVMAPPALGDAARDLLQGSGARTAAFVDRQRTAAWLNTFGTERSARGGAVSREGVFRRAVMLMSLEMWMRDYGLTW